jgi:copper homeostasis protein
MTGKRVIDSEMQFRKDGVNMGLPMLSEYEIWRTDVDNIRAAKKVLEEL